MNTTRVSGDDSRCGKPDEALRLRYAGVFHDEISW